MPRPMSATDRAYTETRTRIIEGDFAGGEVITEGQVSTMLGISRTPVREAFLRLQTEGFLQLYPKRGAVVVPASADEADSITEAREIIESFAMTKLLTENDAAPASLVEGLWDLVAQQERAVRNKDRLAFSAADTAFHMTIVECGHNPFLTALYSSLRDRHRRLARTAMAHVPRFATIVAEHHKLVDLMEKGDLDGCLSALRAHLRASRRDLGATVTPPPAAGQAP